MRHGKLLNKISDLINPEIESYLTEYLEKTNENYLIINKFDLQNDLLNLVYTNTSLPDGYFPILGDIIKGYLKDK